MSDISRPVRIWRQGLLAGFIAGCLDAALIVVAEPHASLWLPLQALIAWTLTGWVVLEIDTGLSPIVHGVIVTILLNVPWFIQFAAIGGQWSHLPPLLVMSVLFGVGFGWTRMRSH